MEHQSSAINVQELIAELEAANEGSRGFDRKILEAFGWRHHQLSDMTPEFLISPTGQKLPLTPINTLPCLTTSLDAALTLVPDTMIEGRKGALWEIDYKLNIGPIESGGLLLNPTTAYRAGVYRGVGKGFARGWHAQSPALALCIAALKAREN